MRFQAISGDCMGKKRVERDMWDNEVIIHCKACGKLVALCIVCGRRFCSYGDIYCGGGFHMCTSHDESVIIADGIRGD